LLHVAVIHIAQIKFALFESSHNRWLYSSHLGRLYINKVGCFFISIADICQIKVGRLLSPEQINATWNWAKEKNYITKDDLISNSVEIANHFLKLLGDNGEWKFVKSIDKAGPSSETNQDLAFIQKIYRGPEKYHFKVVDGNNNTVTDPWTNPLSGDTIRTDVFKYIA
jgi:hypothetical protein